MNGFVFSQSAPQLLQNDDDEHMEELLRNEELENAISAGAVTVRRRNKRFAISKHRLSLGMIEKKLTTQKKENSRITPLN